jgi:hypothetical protein
MMDINLLFSIIVSAIGVVSIIATGAILRELITGSYKRYSNKRMLHLKQLERIEEELKKGGTA